LAVLVAVFAITVGATGCPTAKVETPDLPPATKNLQQGAEALAKGLAAIDPIALNKLLEENAALRDQLSTVRSSLTSAGLGTAVVTLKNRRIVLRIPHHTGTHTVSAWIDDRKNWVWQNRRFLHQEYQLPLDDDAYFLESFRNSVKSNALGISNIISPDSWNAQVKGTIWAHTTYAVKPAFSRFLREAPVSPGPDTEGVEIQEQFLTKGTHTIVVSVTPEKADQSDRWSLRGQLLVLPELSLLKEFDLISDKSPSHPLGQPLPPVELLVSVAAE
jgi:hypothetical protein